MKPRVAFRTIGCRLNQAETAAMAAAFAAAGCEVVPFGAPCDAAVIHGCAVTANAERDSLRAARQARRAAGGAAPLVVLAGCPAQLACDRGAAAPPAVDLLVPHARKFDLPALLHARDPGRWPAPPPGAADTPAAPAPGATRPPVRVQDGCDFHCAYCVVPAARGRPVSRPLEAVVEEVRRLAGAGALEVVLTGANLGLYRDGARALPDLLDALEAVPGLRRIRLSSIEVTTIERAVVDRLAGSEKLCRHLHLPLQSGDDGILRAMGRRYTAADYRRAAEYALARIPRLGLGTDVIAGFPGESDAAFARTLRLVAELPFNNLHVFSYSRRPGTRATALPDPVPPAAIRARTRALLDLGREKRTAFARALAGAPADILVERLDARGRGRGWTSEYVDAEVAPPCPGPNVLVRARVEGYDAARGRLLTKSLA